MVKYAVDEVGCRHIDGLLHARYAIADGRAFGYRNEVDVGRALKQCATPRSEIFITVLPSRDVLISDQIMEHIPYSRR